jgi:hypothetical protein
LAGVSTGSRRSSFRWVNVAGCRSYCKLRGDIATAYEVFARCAPVRAADCAEYASRAATRAGKAGWDRILNELPSSSSAFPCRHESNHRRPRRGALYEKTLKAAVCAPASPPTAWRHFQPKVSKPYVSEGTDNAGPYMACACAQDAREPLAV